MKTILVEIQRCGRILIRFLIALASQVVLAGICVVAGVGLFLAGRHMGIQAISSVGEGIIICGVAYAAWRAIKAQFTAMGQIHRWGK